MCAGLFLSKFKRKLQWGQTAKVLLMVLFPPTIFMTPKCDSYPSVQIVLLVSSLCFVAIETVTLSRFLWGRIEEIISLLFRFDSSFTKANYSLHHIIRQIASDSEVRAGEIQPSTHFVPAKSPAHKLIQSQL